MNFLFYFNEHFTKVCFFLLLGFFDFLFCLLFVGIDPTGAMSKPLTTCNCSRTLAVSALIK
jgi:hypothetical protein